MWSVVRCDTVESVESRWVAKVHSRIVVVGSRRTIVVRAGHSGRGYAGAGPRLYWAHRCGVSVPSEGQNISYLYDMGKTAETFDRTDRTIRLVANGRLFER